MDNLTDLTSSVSGNDSFQLVTIHSCQELLDLNLTWADIAPNDYIIGNNSCGFPLPNFTAIRHHPVKYLTRVTYPVLLAICTFGNLLTLAVLSRNSKQLQSVKWILVMALAFSDLMFLWACLLSYVADVHGLTNPSTNFTAFTDAAAGICSFLSEMFITSSDWILVVFSIERFVAVVFPFRHTVLSSCLSKKVWAVGSIIGIFFLAGICGLPILVDYYWFYFNDDKRCPPQFINRSYFIAEWVKVHSVVIVVIQLMNYMIIVGLNTFAAFRLAYSRQFRTQRISVPEGCTPGYEAAKILFATALIYSLTQCPSFVFNILNLLQQRCAFYMSDDASAIFREIDSFLIYFNYSINFLLYALISPEFRNLVKEFVAKPQEELRHQVSRIGVAKPGVHILEGEVVPNLKRQSSNESVQTMVSDRERTAEIRGTSETSGV